MAIKWNKHVPREKRLVFEFMQKFHPTALQWRNVRMGSYKDQEKDKLYSMLRRYADAVFFENNEVTILEAKMRADPGALSQLKLYKSIFRDTPEYSQYKAFPVKMIFLTTLMDIAVKNLCDEEGIKYIVFTPAWVKIWWEAKLNGGVMSDI